VAVSVFEIARVLVRFDHVAGFIVNANHSIIAKKSASVISRPRSALMKNKLYQRIGPFLGACQVT
jgi:hypothetical protein